MNTLYKSAIDKIELSATRHDEIRDLLANSSCLTPKRKFSRVAPTFAIAAVFALIFIAIPTTRTGFVKAAEYLQKVFQLSDGTSVTITKEDASTSVSLEATAYSDDKFTEIINNRIYFVFNNERIDITDACSNTTYFRYDITDDNGYTHIIFIGGTAQDIGWAEFIFDSDGTYLTNLMNVSHEAEWLLDAQMSIGVPTGNPDIDLLNKRCSKSAPYY